MENISRPQETEGYLAGFLKRYTPLPNDSNLPIA
jgi:hypothetical protein